MIPLLVTGVESSGTRLVALSLVNHPDLLVVHRSFPHGYGDDRHWPDPVDLGVEAVVAVVREQRACSASRTIRHPTEEPWSTENAYRKLFETVAGFATWGDNLFYVVTYEGFCADPQPVIDGICDWLEVRRRPRIRADLGEPIEGGNSKWYG